MSKMEKTWNVNMAEEYNPSLINVRDNIMIEWFNKCAPGLMCVGNKTNPLGN